MKFFKEKKLWLPTIGFTLLLVGLIIAGVVLFQKQTEASLEIPEEVYEVLLPDDEELYRDNPGATEEVKRRVCSKYDLNYQTVTNGEIVGEMLDYQDAVNSLLNEGENMVLVDSNSEKSQTYTLEVQNGDQYAFHGAKNVITDICEAAGIDPTTAKIKDLSEEILMLIHQTAYQVSDHPKD